MSLFAINAIKWIQANWRLIAIASFLGGSFFLGWQVRGYIAEASENAAIAEAVREKELKDRNDYEKEIAKLKRQSQRRTVARTANMDFNTSVSDTCADSPIASEWMRLIQNAYSGGTGK